MTSRELLYACALLAWLLTYSKALGRRLSTKEPQFPPLLKRVASIVEEKALPLASGSSWGGHVC